MEPADALKTKRGRESHSRPQDDTIASGLVLGAPADFVVVNVVLEGVL